MGMKFCTFCGGKHEYSLDIPKFCQNCGKSLGAQPVAPIAKKEITAKRVEKKPLDNEVDEEEDLDREVPQISKIEVEIELDHTPSRISFANVKNAASFARERSTKELSTKDLETRLDTLFQRDRENQKE